MGSDEFVMREATEVCLALSFGTQKINLHPESQRFKPTAKKPVQGSADICFIGDESIYSWIETFKKLSVIIAEDPAKQTVTFRPIT